MWAKFPPRAECPARDAVCYNCKKKGHFNAQCLSKRVAGFTITAQEEAIGETIGDTDPACLNTVEGPDGQGETVEMAEMAETFLL